jgi:hypothetical protein
MNLERAFAHVLTAVTAAPQSVITCRSLRDDLYDMDLANVALKIPAHYAGVTLWACYKMLACVDALLSGRCCAFARPVLYRELLEQQRERMTILCNH